MLDSFHSVWLTPFAFRASTTWAVYLSDGARQNGNTGGWNLPADTGQCVTGIAADGTMTIDETIKSRPDCIARTWPAYTTQATCGRPGHTAHFWVNTCVANDGTPISLNGLDRTAAMCNQAAIAAGKTSGTWAPACTSSWQYKGKDLKSDNGFCYGAMRLTGYTEDTCPITKPGYSWDDINDRCLYAYGIAGVINGDILNLSGAIIFTAGDTVDLSVFDTMGKCLLNIGGSPRLVAGWNNYTTKTGTKTDHGVTLPTGLKAGYVDCLRCHNSTIQYNSYAERWKDTYLKHGHKNMLRKVTAGKKWAGPCPEGQTPNAAGLCVYASDVFTNPIDWATGTINVDGTDRQLFYVFGDWMAPNPYTVYANPAGSMVTNGYACASCHATGWSDASAGLCSKSSKLTSADCTAAGGTWYPSTGVQGVAGKEPQKSFPGISGITGTWDQDGIVCSRCHASTWPPVYSGTTAITAAHNLSTAIGGAATTNLCFGCHQSLATDYTTGDKILDPVQIPTGGSHGAVWAREFNGHVLGNQFLNSPHGAFKGAVVPNSLGKYDLVSGGTFGTSFGDIFCRNNNDDGTPNAAGAILTTNADGTKIKTSAQCATAGGTWWIGQSQGSCSTCHDVHQSIVPEVGAAEPLKRECIDCHADKADLTKINHLSGTGTPLALGTRSCEVCHMPKPTSEGYPMHLWRINTDSAYDTFPSQAEFYGGICSKNPMDPVTGFPINTTQDLCEADFRCMDSCCEGQKGQDSS